MRWCATLSAVALLLLAAPAGASWSLPAAVTAAADAATDPLATPFVLLGEDPAGDAPEGFDLTAFKVRRVVDDLEFRFEIEDLAEDKHRPYSGTVWWDLGTSRDDYDTQWWVVADLDTPERYYVQWSCCTPSGGGYGKTWSVEGEYNWQEGYVSVFAPAKTFGPPGTVLTHCRGSDWYSCPKGAPDIRIHSHLGTHGVIVIDTRDTDTIRNNRDYVIPRKPRG